MKNLERRLVLKTGNLGARERDREKYVIFHKKNEINLLKNDKYFFYREL